MSTPTGALTKFSPGQTDRVAEIVARTTASARRSAPPIPAGERDRIGQGLI
jgi:hypothetical protein